MTTTAKTIQKGLREITYSNKDGSKVVKYQVRISTKEMPNFNVLFDDLVVAKEIIANSKTFAGRVLIKSLKINSNEKKTAKKSAKERFDLISDKFSSTTDGEVLNAVLSDESITEMLGQWFRLNIKKSDDNEVDKKNNKTYESMIKSICSTRIVDWHRQNRIIENLPINMRSMISDPKKIAMGEISIFELDSRNLLDYINTRLNDGKAKSTVAREINIISSMFNKLHYFGSRYKEIVNPVDKELKQKLKNNYQKRDVRITTEEEIRLEKALRDMRNEDMLFIFALALATGCRRSEILFWEWSNVFMDDNYYSQKRTKTGVSRKVKLLPQAKEILKRIPKVENRDRIFNYTIEGFKTNFQRAKKSVGLGHVQFRDLRNEFISRLLEQTNNPIVVSSAANIKNQNYFQATYGNAKRIKEFLESDGISPENVHKQVGHATNQMTSDYNRTDFANDGSLEYRIKELKLKIEFNKATEQERSELLALYMQSNK